MKDPFPYDGPICRADGVKSFNRYLWPMGGDGWWPNHEDTRLPYGYHFAVVALNDGRWSTSGTIRDIECEVNEDGGWRYVFDTRQAAIRAAAARQIRKARYSRTIKKTFGGYNISNEDCQRLVSWILAAVTNEQARSARAAPIMAPAYRTKPCPFKGLPLFENHHIMSSTNKSHVERSEAQDLEQN